MPAVQRIVYLPFPGETQTAQALITNAVDSSLDLRPNTMKQILAQNPKIQSWTGGNAPYGYTDWWPTSLYVDTTKAPFDDKDIRWAVSYLIDRQQLIDVTFNGASTATGKPVVSQCAAILPDTSAGNDHGESAICSSVPSAKSPANRRGSDSSDASSAATHNTPGPSVARSVRSGVEARGNSVTTMT